MSDLCQYTAEMQFMLGLAAVIVAIGICIFFVGKGMG